MDRRYTQARFYDGMRAIPSKEARSDALVKRYLERARNEARVGNSYGGSTGGVSSIDSNRGLEVIQSRNQSIAETREIFKELGSGAVGGATLGARKLFNQARALPELPS